MRPYRSSTATGVIRARSETPLRGYSTVVRSLTSWNASRSPVTMSTSNPAASAWLVKVAITSSASNPSTWSTGTFSAPSTSWIRLTCPLKSSGVALRVALYSGYSSLRNVWRETSKATARWVGRSSRSALISMEVKP